MMDKQTIWVVVGCLIALVAWQWIVNRLYPPRPKAPKPPVAAVETNEVAAVVEPEPVAPEQVLQQQYEYEYEADQPPPAEQIAVLENGLVRVEFTSWGGGVRFVELLRHKANGDANIVLNGGNVVPALALKGIPGAGAEDAFELQQPTLNSVVMRTRTRAGLVVTKTFSLGDGYLLSGRVELERTASYAETPPPVEIVVGTATLASAKETEDFLNIGWLAGQKFHYRGLKHIEKNAARGVTGEPVSARWASVKNQFFTMILTPATNAVAVEYETLEVPAPSDWQGKRPPRALTASLKLPATSATVGGVDTYEFTWYAGPKEYDRLAALGNGQEEVMQFGFWGAISVILLKSMKFFYKLIPNYGVAIILVTIVIKILFWPVQAKSIKSMKEMQKFQPLMQKLREKYKDDPQRMNAEMMKLYKEHKINPFAGCLPMLVQIPVFFAFFTMLRTAVELRGAAFLWIRDLSQPDTVARLAGFPLNPLPLLMGASMVWQMKLTPTTGDPKQQQIMMLMPLMFLFVCYNMSSGLVLYWTVQQFLSIAQQWWSMRQPVAAAAPPPALGAGKSK